jgi:hypothetical protein
MWQTLAPGVGADVGFVATTPSATAPGADVGVQGVFDEVLVLGAGCGDRAPRLGPEVRPATYTNSLKIDQMRAYGFSGTPGARGSPPSSSAMRWSSS